jgi:SAM-dependent methyltransferase
LADWLAGPRGRLLRRAGIGHRRRVLELGCGHCSVTPELVRRAAGPVVALDRDIRPALAAGNSGAALCCAEAAALPFRDGVFDLALCQNVLLWAAAPSTMGAARPTASSCSPAPHPLGLIAAELRRVLCPGGAVVAIEPDYGGMMEYPEEISVRDLWLRGLSAAGADPSIGRRLPAALEQAGFSIWLELQGIPQPATPQATAFLLDLPLEEWERRKVTSVAQVLRGAEGTWEHFVHVPYFLLVATRS